MNQKSRVIIKTVIIVLFFLIPFVFVLVLSKYDPNSSPKTYSNFNNRVSCDDLLEDEVLGDWRDDFFCVTYFAAKNNDPSLCQLMGSGYVKGCLVTVASLRNDPSICEDPMLVKENRVDSCYRSYEYHKRPIIKFGYIFWGLCAGLLFSSLAFLFLFRKNTKTKLLFSAVFTLVPVFSTILISTIHNKIIVFDSTFPYRPIKEVYHLGVILTNSDPNILSTFDSFFIYIFAFCFMIFVYLPAVALRRAYVEYKNSRPWSGYLWVFFAMQLFGIVMVGIGTAFYGIFIGLIVSAISIIVLLLIFFIALAVNKKDPGA